MSLPEYRTSGKQSSPVLPHNPVVQLNVGGHLFTTSMSTLRKHPDSRLAELFSGPAKARTDAQGRFFIDRDGSHFAAVLEFLRSERLPTHNIQQVLIRIAKAEAIAARRSTIIICVLRTEEDRGCYDNAVSSLEADKESVVTFGPWKPPLSAKDLLDCVKMDIQSRGYAVDVQPHAVDTGFLSRSYDYFYKLTFTWW